MTPRQVELWRAIARAGRAPGVIVYVVDPKAPAVCGCGHPWHPLGPCTEWHRPPTVVVARPCACVRVWRRP